MKKIFTLGLLCSSMLLSGQNADAKFTAFRKSLLKSDGYTYQLDSLQFQYLYDSGWDTDVTHKFHYNAAGMVDTVYEIQKVEDEMDEVEVWTLKYDQKGLLSELVQGFTVYDEDGNGYFIENQKEVYEYNSEGNEISCIISYAEDIDVMTPTTKLTTTYDPDVISSKSFDWDADSDTWIPSSSYFNYVDVYNGKDLIRDTAWTWDEDGAEYLLSSLTEYTYTNGVLTTSTESQWRGSSFLMFRKTEYQYDANGNGISELNYNWDKDASTWNNDGKYEMSYNFEINMSQTAFTTVSEFETDYCEFKNAPITSVFKYWDGIEFITEGRTMFYLSEFKAGTVTPETPGTGTFNQEKSISAEYFPVPATDLLTINAPVDNGTVTLTNANGDVVFSGTFTNTTQIPVSGLSRGIYICTIYTADATFSETITVE